MSLENRKVEDLICGVCGKMFRITRPKRRKKCCSQECSKILQANNIKKSLRAINHRPSDEARRLSVIACTTEEWKERRRQAFKKNSFYQTRLRELQKESMKNDPRFCKGRQHLNCKIFSLRDPRGMIHIFKNLRVFIEENPNLFNPDDIIWERREYAGKKGVVKTNFCRALSLQMLRPTSSRKYIPGQWKGWTWYSELENKLNDGRDLLGRDEKHLK